MKDANEFLEKYPEGGCIKMHDGRVACFISHEVLKEALVLKTLQRADFVYVDDRLMLASQLKMIKKN